MTFSQKVKNEIIGQGVAEDSRLSILAGILLSCGSLVFKNKNITFCIASENSELIKFAKGLILLENPAAILEEETVRRNFKNKEKIEMIVDESAGSEILSTLGIIFMDENGNRQINSVPSDFLICSEENRIAFLKGAFLGSGSISVPSSIEFDDMKKSQKSSGYHMEWVLSNLNLASKISEIISLLDIFPKQVERYESYVVYIKESENISDLLAFMHAHKCLLELENDKAGRQMRNLINRQANCISANIDKAINAAMNQIEAIEIIQNTIGIEALPDPLQEVALARLSNPEGSLVDIQSVLESKISKGAVSQRFKKIIQISKELQE